MASDGFVLKKILIVDDQATIRLLLRVTLLPHYQLFEAVDGERALELIKTEQPDAVLLDILLPGKFDGLSVLDAIKSNPATEKTLVAMVTSKGQTADCRVAQLRGADAYFIKPFSPACVLQWLQESLACQARKNKVC